MHSKSKFILVVLFGVISSFGCRLSNKVIISHPYTFKQVQSVLDSQIVQWNNGSVDGFMKGYWNSDSLLFITSKGPRYGFQMVLNSYKKNYPTKEKMGQLAFEVLKIQWIDSAAGISQVLGKWKIIELNRQKVEGYFSLIFKYIDGGPKIVIDHTW